MVEDDNGFEPRLGRMRSTRGKGAARSLQGLLLHRVARSGGDIRRIGSVGRASGRFNARGRGRLIAPAKSESFAWTIDPISRLRVRARRVTVKARVVKLGGAKKLAGAVTHLRYLQRDGVTREGERGSFYSTFFDEADGKAFLERAEGDRHQFRFIVSPEDGASLDTLKTFTRQLMATMEQDLCTNLDWVAVDHFDTGHPHTHVLVRGVTEDGKTLNIAGDYIAHGIRQRASEIMTRSLGMKSELEVREQLAREIDAERLTGLDRSLLRQSRDGVVDLSLRSGADREDGSYQQLLIARARQLERMQLAERAGRLAWKLEPDIEQVLGDLGRRRDIIAAMHRAITVAKLSRRPELYQIHDRSQEAEPVIGMVVAAGTSDEHHERRYLIVDGIDGRTHYVDIGGNLELLPRGAIVRIEPAVAEVRPADRTVAAIAAANRGRYDVDIHLRHDPGASIAFARAHVRRLEALRRGGVGVERHSDGSWTIAPHHLDRALGFEQARLRVSPNRVELVSQIDLDKQVVEPAPTWLDRQLRREDQVEIREHGYGREVRRALYQRQQWLIQQGLAQREGDKVLYPADMEEVLRQRELRAAVMRLSKELGLRFEQVEDGDRIEGIYRRRVDLASGRYALIEKSREFSLVPWRPVLERRLGREVSGLMRSSGSISWELGRQRPGPEIGM